MVNTDVSVFGGSIPCPVPPCAGADFLMHWVGHIDFACLPATNCQPDPPAQTWNVVVSLHHLPGVISHDPATVPSRALPAAQDHPITSYHLVSPAAFAWFPAAQPPIMGNFGSVPLAPGCTTQPPLLAPTFGQGMRAETVAGACNRREVGLLNQAGAMYDCFSFCSSPQGWWDIQFGPFPTFLGTQNANLVSVPCGRTDPGGVVPQTGIIAVVVGYWFNINVYPYTQALTLYWGCAQYRDPCAPPPPPPAGSSRGVPFPGSPHGADSSGKVPGP